MTRSTPLVRFLLITLVGCAVVWFLWQFFQLDGSMAQTFLPPAEVR